MPIELATSRRFRRFLAVSLLAVVLTAFIVPRAHAQIFEWTPFNEFTNGGGSVLFSLLTVTLNPTGLGNSTRTEYTVAGISGTFQGQSISILAPNTNVGGRMVNNRVFHNTSNGNVFTGNPTAPTMFSEGFGFSTSAGNFVVCDSDCTLASGQSTNTMFVFNSAGAQLSGTSGRFEFAAVPGPLAGAGMLSYLAALVMGMAWRRKWLLAKLRHWLEAVKSTRARAA